jgi:hypothetical protein
MSEDREMLIESNPNLKSMHNELLKKKAQRMMMQNNVNLSFKSGTKIGLRNERLKGTVDEIELAEQQYFRK